MELFRVLQNVLGTGKQLRNHEVAFHCPFCNHYKPKLQVNLESHNWHCWVCNSKGRKIVHLFKKLKVSNQILNQLFEIVDEYVPIKNKEDIKESVSLPKEMLYLWDKRNTPEYKHVMMYLLKRGITAKDVLKYGIGYCEDGVYGGRIIVPSYDNIGKLNYFIGRSFYKNSTMKYKNPKVSKDIVGFDLFINWNLPIVLCEGVFDAIAIKRNAIPLFGKIISKSLYKKTIEKRVKDIYIALDTDAIVDSLKMTEMFLNEGRNVYMITLPHGKDPASIGFKEFTNLVRNTKLITYGDLMKYKLSLI